MMNGSAKRGIRSDCPAEVSSQRAVMDAIAGNRVARIEAREIGKVIELIELSADRTVLAITAEVAAVGRISEKRLRCRPAGSADAYDAGHGIGAVQSAVGSAQNLYLRNRRAGHVGKLHIAADVIDRDIVNKNLIRIRASAANEQTGRASGLANLIGLEAGHIAQPLLQLLRSSEIVGVEHRYGCAQLRLRRGRAGRRNRNLFGISCDRENNIDGRFSAIAG